MTLHRSRYIPIGCLSVRKTDLGPQDAPWLPEDSSAWFQFCACPPPRTESQAEAAGHDVCLSAQVQRLFLDAPRFLHLSRLFRSHWARLEARVCPADPAAATIRVYLLPDDVCRGEMDRTNFILAKARQALLRQLDYCQDAWHGLVPPLPADHVSLSQLGQCETGDDISLLHLFNRIPSPDPDPNMAGEPHVQDAVYSLYESSLPGLKTSLYPYQRRSAALMLQRETQPGRILDPRLVAVTGNTGQVWYMDTVAGTILSEARYYDGVRGGILAEEMGAGKTLICLALVLASKDLPTTPPEAFQGGRPPTRRRLASLADIAASCATRHAVPWRPYFQVWRARLGYEFDRCVAALDRNPGYYLLPPPQARSRPRRSNRNPELPRKMLLSPATVITVPSNLVAQWRQEIAKHTTGLRVLVLAKQEAIPPPEKLLEYDILLFSQPRFEGIVKLEGGIESSPLSSMHFKRCIVDEGHKLGNSRIGHRSNLLIGLDAISFSSRWIVTGTPSHGLFGAFDDARQIRDHEGLDATATHQNETSVDMEKKDLQRLGSIASLYLKARPWANTHDEKEDTTADWDTYLLLPRHNPRSYGRWDCLKSTLNGLIVRHQLADVGDLLPPVEERTVVLDGSFQDKLSLNVFAMMIIFNAVQSQRTDVDYFFHARQRRSLLQIVHNLKQTSFFGGSFFASHEIAKAVETAEAFLRDGKVPISRHDESLLREAIDLGHMAARNRLRGLSNQFHEMPVWVRNLPAQAGRAWSLDGRGGDAACTSASMLLSLQRLLYHSAARPEAINTLLNGGLVQEGALERDRMLASREPEPEPGGRGKRRAPDTMAGNTKPGDDSPRKPQAPGIDAAAAAARPREGLDASKLPASLQLATISSTVSAKLSYLIDSIFRHQEQEKMIVFYENENVAWYLASVLDVLQIQHLIYARGLTAERRAQYVNAFHHNPVFRVLLMDLSQAAFGLDMREASRIYFINPVLNPQVEAQAIGRVRRISQQKPVSVETLVLKNSIDEVILERRRHMTQAEHRQAKSILDIRPIYNWIKNARIVGLDTAGGGGGGDDDGESQMAALRTPQPLFGRGFGRPVHADEGLVSLQSPVKSKPKPRPAFSDRPLVIAGTKRAYHAGPGSDGPG